MDNILKTDGHADTSPSQPHASSGSPDTARLPLPNEALALRKTARTTLKVLSTEQMCILTVATTAIYGEVVQFAAVDEHGQTLLNAVVKSGPSEPGAQALHGVTPQIQARTGIELNAALAMVEEAIRGRTVVTFSSYVRDVLRQIPSSVLMTQPGVDMQWATAQVFGAFNHTTERFQSLKLTEALELLEVTSDAGWAALGTALGNAQRIGALTRAAIARAAAHLEPGTYFDNVHGIHNEMKVVKLALDRGWSDEQARQVLEVDEPQCSELWDGVFRDALNFLNTLVPDGFTFGTNDSLDWGVYDSSVD